MTRPSRQPLYGFVVLAILGALVSTLLPARKVLITGPAPYRTPRTFGGTALRMAMVHDVLHQRYPRHGTAYYEHRAASVRARLADVDLESNPSLEDLALLDDLSAALDHLHRAEEAVGIQQRKLRLLGEHYPDSLADIPAPFFDDPACIGIDCTEEAMRRLSQPDPEPARMSAYRTHANLGTHLIHASFRAALAGDAAARARLEEGLEHIRKAIGIRPGAHFGREEWQVNAVETLLAQLDDPTPRFDLVGNDLMADPPDDPEMFDHRWHPRSPLHTWHRERGALEAWIAGSDIPPDARQRGLEPAASLRTRIRRVNFRDPRIWDSETPHPWPPGKRYPDGVPFDEPTLAVLGMWMLGGGPNPQFALALGGIMEQVEQRHLAWAAYARALELGGESFPHAERCNGRMRAIEKSLWHDNGPSRGSLQALFEKELAEGKAWQAAYQDYEAERIAAGDDPEAPDFYAAFHRTHGSIASSPGPEDTLRIHSSRPPGRGRVDWGMALLCAGIGGLLGSLVGPREKSKRRRGVRRKRA